MKARSSRAKARSTRPTRRRPAPPRPPAPPADPTTDYARDVLAGKILAGRYVRLACARHLRDLERAEELGLEWRPWEKDARGRRGAAHAIGFIEAVLVLAPETSPGAGDAVPFKLEPYQRFIVGNLFGWYKRDGHRRFNSAYVEMGKGSGKSPLGAAVGLYMLVADNEPAPEVYSAATMKDQAKVVWKDAYRMVRNSPELRELVQHPDAEEVLGGILSIPSESAVFRPLSAEHRGLDGKRVHCALIDELHEHTSPTVVDKMTAGTKARLNALVFEMTNSGHDRTSVCWHHHETSVGILEGTLENVAWFAYVCTLDACDACAASGKTMPQDDCPTCDDWRDPRVWLKTNPGLGTVLPVAYLERRVNDAKAMPSKENETKRFNFCIWTESDHRWLSLDLWDKGKAEPVVEDGADVCVGLDMSSPMDLCSAAFLFGPDDAGGYGVRMKHWLPEEALRPREGRELTDRQRALQAWASAGFITLTDGEVCDYDRVEAELLAELEAFNLRALGFNPDEMTQMATHLIDELGKTKVLRTTQSYAGISEACKRLEALLVGGLLHHGGEPVLRWTASNVSIAHGPREQIKIDRDTSVEKVAVAALVTALAQEGKANAEELDDWDGTVGVVRT